MPVSIASRRTFLQAIALTAAGAALPAVAATFSAPGAVPTLQPRGDGELDIHHIHTGRGNCTLVVAPDGTSLMIDAGASIASSATSSAAQPDASLRAGQWQARYAARFLPAPRLDYFLATHIHPDHVGDVEPTSPPSPTGAFRLTGVSDVDTVLPIFTVLDRGFPRFGRFPPLEAPFARNYTAFLERRTKEGRDVQALRAGSNSQILLRHQRERFPSFSVRNLAASGSVWTGKANDARSVLPANLTPSEKKLISENVLSCAIRIEYGKFSYFAGGDLSADTHDGAVPWLDVETPVVRAAGRTEVAAADHHGYFDACGPEFVRSLAAQAYIVQAWDVGHPGTAQLQRMLGAWTGTATSDVFALDTLPASELVNRRFTPLLRSRHGHVVVRVAAGGETYRIFVVDSTVEDGPVMAAFGPYRCRR